MIEVKINPDKAALDRITTALDGISYKAPTILKDASNETGKYAVKKIVNTATRRYVFDNTIHLKNAIKRKRATYANPRTVISIKSRMNKMIHFMVTPGRPANMSGRPSMYKGKVLRSSAAKPLIENGVKAFIIRFPNGGAQVVKRIPGKTYSGKNIEKRREKKLDTTKIDVMYSPSETHMMSKGFDLSEEDINIQLQKNIKKHINKFMERLGK